MTGTGTHLPLSPSALKGRGGTQTAPPEAFDMGRPVRAAGRSARPRAAPKARSQASGASARRLREVIESRAGERWGCSLFSVSGLFGAALSAVLLAGLLLATSSTAADDPFAEERAAMVRAVAETTDETAEWIGKAALSPRVMEAMGRVPRHLFVPPDLQDMGYLNRPLPIGYGQTISQPYIVALMTDLLEPEPEDVAFELGTGSSYQAAVLAELVAEVYTVEIVPPLAASATERLETLGYDNVTVRAGDGYHGWPEHAPFDIVVVTAAASHVPPPLIAQLKPGGRMVIPVGSPFLTQHLLLIEKGEDGTVTSRQILPVIFVPLTGGH